LLVDFLVISEKVFCNLFSDQTAINFLLANAGEIRRISVELHAVIYKPPAGKKKGLQKAIIVPLKRTACGIRKLHATPIVFCNTAG